MKQFLYVALSCMMINLGSIAQARECVVLPLGDSITEGSGYGDQAPNYRCALANYLEAAQMKPRFLGARDLKTGTITQPNCRVHTGISGHRIRSVPGRAGFLPGIENWLDQAGYPDVITLMIGTNDILGTKNVDGKKVFEDWCLLVERILRERPDAWLIVSPIIPQFKETLQKHETRQKQVLNDAIRSLFDLREKTRPCKDTVGGSVRCVLGTLNNAGRKRFGARARLRMADMEAAIGTPVAALYYNNGNDITHPSQAGYNRMATAWFAAIQALPAQTVRGAQAAPKVAKKEPQGARERIPEARAYKRLCSGTIAENATLPAGQTFSDFFTADNTWTRGKPFRRVAYYLELARPSAPVRHIWVSFDALPELDEKGLPHSNLQARVKNLCVRTNMPGIQEGEKTEGILQFTPHTIAPQPPSGKDYNGFDWNDTLHTTGAYGAFQLYRCTPQGLMPAETLFSYNRWAIAEGPADEIQIGSISQHVGYRGGWRGSNGQVSFNGILSADWPSLSTVAYRVRRFEVWAR